MVEKYGKEFAKEAVDNSDGKVAERVVKKLKVEPPGEELVTLYLTEIARTYKVPWPKQEESEELDVDEDDDDTNYPSGGQAVKTPEEPLTTKELNDPTPPQKPGPKSPVSVVPRSPGSENPTPRLDLLGPPQLKPGAKMTKKQNSNTDTSGSGVKKSTVGGDIPRVDELERRFAALKK